MGIGRKVKLFTDFSRQDFYSGESFRRIPVSIFYPTMAEGTSHYEDLYAPQTELLVKIYGEGKKDRIQHLKQLETSFLNDAAPDLSQPRPVIVFSHGLEADRDFYLFLIEPLVREGYVVATTGHLYDTDVTLLPTGETVPMKPGLLAESSFDERTSQIEARSKDMMFVLDQLAALNETDEWNNLLDLNRIALAGHSLGGMTVLKSMVHPLAKAGVLLDAALAYLDAEPTPGSGASLNKPILNFRRGDVSYGDRLRRRVEQAKDKSPEKFREILLKEHASALADEAAVRALYHYAGGDCRQYIYMDRTVHMTFCDWFWLVSDKQDKRNLPIEEAHRSIVQVVSSFYREYLLEQGTPYSDLICSAQTLGIHPEVIAPE